MGVSKFTKVFENSGEFKDKDFKGKNIVIDASVEIYRASLGMKASETLTDASGNPTAHINVILLGVILKLKAAGANQYWIFDHNQPRKDGEAFHNPMKELELQKRRQKRKIANGKLDSLKTKLDSLTLAKDKALAKDELFSDDDSDPNDEITCKKDAEINIADINKDIDKQKKVAFTLEKFYIEDVLFMLNMLDIPWMECPPGFESEQIAAFTTYNRNILGKKMDFVLTPDVDCLLFGATKMIKRDTRKKKFFRYDLDELRTNYEISQDDLIKIALILGTDFAEKTPRIGEKTVLKKYKDVVLSDTQQCAFEIFKRSITNAEVDDIVINNSIDDSFKDEEKFKQLLDWIELVKSFNRSRIVKLFHKQKLFLDIS